MHQDPFVGREAIGAYFAGAPPGVVNTSGSALRCHRLPATAATRLLLMPPAPSPRLRPVPLHFFQNNAEVERLVPKDVRFCVEDITDGDPRACGVRWCAGGGRLLLLLPSWRAGGRGGGLARVGAARPALQLAPRHAAT